MTTFPGTRQLVLAYKALEFGVTDVARLTGLSEASVSEIFSAGGDTSLVPDIGDYRLRSAAAYQRVALVSSRRL